jgi:hypothetical protein
MDRRRFLAAVAGLPLLAKLLPKAKAPLSFKGVPVHKLGLCITCGDALQIPAFCPRCDLWQAPDNRLEGLPECTHQDPEGRRLSNG